MRASCFIPMFLALASVACAHETDRALLPANAAAHGAPPVPDSAEFFAVSDLDQSSAGPQLIGGTPADPADYPASYYARHGSGACTGTLVSETVLLTAAHCVTGSYKATLRRAGVTYRATCEAAPEYLSGTSSADYALCLLDKPLAGVRYERVSTVPAHVKKGKSLMLAGFGCIKADMTLGNDGVYRYGTTTVDSVPKDGNNTIVTRGGVALCPGDSGGAAFVQTRSGRMVVSVNSAVRIVPGSDPVKVDPALISHLASLSSPTAGAFITSWRTAKGVKICGLDATAAGCR
jgi:hypothetical protein